MAVWLISFVWCSGLLMLPDNCPHVAFFPMYLPSGSSTVHTWKTTVSGDEEMSALGNGT